MILKKRTGNISGLKLLSIIILIFTVISLSGCASFGPQEIDINKDSNGKTIKCTVDDTITINLEGNATTGYTWILKKYNEDLIRFIDVNYITSDSNLVGVGGKWVAKFKILKPGKSEIIFVYKRPWETEKTPLENYFVNINAKNKAK